MSLFTWNVTGATDPDKMSTDEFATEMAIEYPVCFFCGEQFNRGAKVWHWSAATKLTAHVECLRERAPGIMRDIAEALK